MSSDRDKLIELIRQGKDMTPCEKDNDYRCEGIKCADCESKSIADYLLANGVIVPPCKVGDYVLWDNGLKDSKRQIKQVIGFHYDSYDLGLRFILEDCSPTVNFPSVVGILTKEEAEQKLKELGK